MDDIPDDFTFRDSMTCGGPGQEQFVGWACGGNNAAGCADYPTCWAPASE